jgi:hypothetical protein
MAQVERLGPKAGADVEYVKNPTVMKKTQARLSPVAGQSELHSPPTSDRNPVVSSTPIRTRCRLLNGFRSIAIIMVFTAIVTFSAAEAGTFTLTNTALPAVGYSSVFCGDFNNDGKADVVLTGSGSSFTPISQLWHNQANGLFTNLNAAFPGVSSSAVACGDMDHDGRIDLLLTGFAGVDVNKFPIYLSQVWHNLGNGIFSNLSAGLPGIDTGAVALGDFFNEGNLDILLTGYSSTGAVAQVWRNLGNGSFTNMNAGLPGVLYSSVALGDYDNDGNLDILLTGTTNGFGSAAITQLWHNLGNGTFTNVITDLPGVTQGAVAWGDFNQDGRLDILLTGYSQTGAVCQVWRNLGNGAFTNMNVGLPGIYQSSVALADYDNDGKLDIVIAGLNSQAQPICQVWRNTGNWVFTNINAGFTGIYSGSVAWADFDHDGRLDLLLSGLDSAGNPTIEVYHNNTAVTNAFVPRIIGLKTRANHCRELSFGGQPGFSYNVWASTNLMQWTGLGIANEEGSAVFQFTDPAANSDQRFYRVSRP